MKTTPKFSPSISRFLDMMSEAVDDYAWNEDEVSRLDRLTQDYLHKLELEELPYNERAKLATALRRCRRERRASKDTVEILAPLVDFLDSDKGRSLINLMKEVLGKTRKVEERMSMRTYRNRVLYDPK